EYLGVQTFTLKMKNTIMDAHDSILAHQVKETRSANHKRIASPFQVGDLVYILTRNMIFPKGLARKLVPKFVGPYRILKKYNESLYKIEI
ncbi:hypothetical protein P691DRAFT_637755, partial [Macrolepiota fuliginosa MF-IS2]